MLPKDTAVVVPLNELPLVLSSDSETIKADMTHDQAGIAVRWNFLTFAGVFTSTAVTPTSSGLHDLSVKGGGMYGLALPAESGDANNNAFGRGWFTGKATGILAWKGPVIDFVAQQVIDGVSNATAPALTAIQRLLAAIVRGDDNAVADLTAELDALNADFGSGGPGGEAYAPGTMSLARQRVKADANGTAIAGVTTVLDGMNNLVAPTAPPTFPMTQAEAMAWDLAVNGRVLKRILNVSGAEQLRNQADDGDIATATISDSGGVTTVPKLAAP